MNQQTVWMKSKQSFEILTVIDGNPQTGLFKISLYLGYPFLKFI
jgi:hypothetical protein